MQRKHDRVTIFTEIVLNSASGNRDARISDLSAGGCFVDTIVTARVGEEVSLKMTLPPGDVIEVTGNVAYVFDGTGFGVSFTSLSDSARKSIEEFVASNTQ